jgi:endonuclease/exonuclease/phosphatase family metal-dependent hydrolase
MSDSHSFVTHFWKHFRKQTAVLLAAITILSAFTTVAGAQNRGIGGKRDVDVMTVNLYIGADFTPITTLDPSDPLFGLKLLNGVASIYGHIVASNFPKRADALAQEIVARAPDAVALQEVTMLRRQSPGDAIAGGQTPATQVELDFLAVLLAAIQQHGGNYVVASQIQDVDVEVPLATSPTTFDDLRLTDRDVILTRSDLPPGQMRTFNPQAANFGAFVPLPIGVNVLRGWCSIDLQVRDRTFRLINTHLEDRLPAGAPNVQLGQAMELLLSPTGPANTSLPLILAGDFNSDLEGNYSPATYGFLVGAGFVNAWSAAHPGQPGLTWGHDESLANPAVAFSLRLDHIFYRGGLFDTTDALVIDPVIGAAPPLWFSDHAALFATISIR